jgi:hypothetical protein
MMAAMIATMSLRSPDMKSSGLAPFGHGRPRPARVLASRASVVSRGQQSAHGGPQLLAGEGHTQGGQISAQRALVSQEQDGQVRPSLPQILEQVHADHARHAQTADQEVALGKALMARQRVVIDR